MSLLFEQPLPILAGGVLAVAVCLVGLLRSGRFAFLYLAAGAVVLTLFLLFIESRVVTPREEIATTLASIASDLESNDLDRVLRHVSKDQEGVQATAAEALRRGVIHRVALKRNLEVEFALGEDPPSARASFNAVITGSEKKGAIREQSLPLFLVVNFVNEDGEWKVVDYERHPPQKGLQR